MERMRAPPDIDSDDDDEGDENEDDEDDEDDDDGDDDDGVDSDDDDGLDAVRKDENYGGGSHVDEGGESNGKRRIVERNRGGHVASLV